MTEPTATAEALNDLRQRYLAGQSWTREELKTAIHTMIGQRLQDVQAAAAPKTKKAKVAAISLDDMLPAPEKSKLDPALDMISFEEGGIKSVEFEGKKYEEKKEAPKSKLDQKVDAIMSLGRALDNIEPKEATAAPVAKPKKPVSDDGFF